MDPLSKALSAALHQLVLSRWLAPAPCRGHACGGAAGQVPALSDDRAGLVREMGPAATPMRYGRSWPGWRTPVA